MVAHLGFLKAQGVLDRGTLSPYLFVLGMEALSLLLDKATPRGFISGHSFKGRNGFEGRISHLLYADDTLIFCKDIEDHLAHLSWILMWLKLLQA